MAFENLTNQQAGQSIGVGQVGAQISDPFSPERANYQNQLRTLTSNPGSMTTSPYYQFALNQGLNALQRKGTVRSGNKLAELMKYGEGVASQGYFNQAGLLSTLSGATTGSPAAAGQQFTSGFNRSQDQRQVAASQAAYQPQNYMPQVSSPSALPTGGMTPSYGGGGGNGGGGYYDPTGGNNYYAGSGYATSGDSYGGGYDYGNSGDYGGSYGSPDMGGFDANSYDYGDWA